MKQHITSLLQASLKTLQKNETLPADITSHIQIERCRDPKHGDFATNIALALAKPAKIAPRALAEQIVAHLPESKQISDVVIAGPGFINFTLDDQARLTVIAKVLQEGQQFGRSKVGAGKRLYMEYVSANPTGPLHVGHGRSAAYGACVASLLEANGYEVHQEYYVNDAGRQMQILALSIWLRYQQECGEDIALPANAYQGTYIIDIAKHLKTLYQDQFHQSQDQLNQRFPAELDPAKNGEAHLDAMIEAAIDLIGKNNFDLIRQTGLEQILADIEDDLAEFGVTFNNWFRENRLFKEGLLNAGIQLLKDHGHTYQKDGALWFKAVHFGDEKDRVLLRANGQPTYFASDVAYHLYKYNQGYDEIIDIFGADHHGYIARIRAFLQGLGEDPEKLKILLVQFAILYRGKQKIAMSTRSGTFVTLRELRYEVGNDAARFFYIMRKPDQHLDFDLDLAKSESSENPVYYIQYAHARICSVWRQMESQQMIWEQQQGLENLSLLNTRYEKNLISSLSRYPEIIHSAGIHYEPHVLAHYLQDFAHQFHTYYNAHKFLVPDNSLRNARLCLIAAAQQILTNGLKLLGLAAPKMM